MLFWCLYYWILNSLTSSFSVFIVNFEQLNACQDDKDDKNDGHNADIDITVSLTNLVF